MIVIWGRPNFLVNFSKVEIDLITDCSRLHYDGTCKSLSVRGGFIYGWQFYDFDESGLTKVHIDFHQIDLLMKCLEFQDYRPGPEVQIIQAIRKRFYKAIDLSQELAHTWTHTINE